MNENNRAFWHSIGVMLGSWYVLPMPDAKFHKEILPLYNFLFLELWKDNNPAMTKQNLFFLDTQYAITISRIIRNFPNYDVVIDNFGKLQ